MSIKYSLEKLATDLNCPEWEVRLVAVKELRHFSNEQAVPLLLNALSDEDEHVRRRAIETLVKYKDDRMVNPLMAMLNDESILVRRQAVEALGELGDARAIDALLAQLSDSDSRVQILAVVALTSFPGPMVMQAFSHLFANPTAKQIRGAVAFALGPWNNEQLISLLIKALVDEDWRVRLRAVEALAQRKNTRAVVPLLAALSDENVFVRCRVIEVLGQLGDERAVAPLIPLLAEKDEQIRKATIQGLVPFERQEVARAFAEVLEKDPGVQVRSTLVSALWEWGDRALPIFLSALSDKDLEVRCRAAQALGKYSNERVVDPLIAALADDALRATAIEALGKLGNERAIDPLLSQLFERDEGEIHRVAAVALASFGISKVAQAFTRAIEDSMLRPLRSAVTFALGYWRHEQAVPLLLIALADEDWHVRETAAEALAKHHDKRSVVPLLAALNDENLLVHCRTIEALGKVDDERVIDPLIKQFSSKERQIRIAATVALASFHRQQVVQVFLMAFEEEPAKEVLAHIVAAFGQWRERRAVEPLVAALQVSHQGLSERIRLMQAIAQIYNDEQLLDILQRIINHQGDSDAYISLTSGKMMKWYQAVEMALDQTLHRSKE